ncbi:2-hydroxyisoflavanone dehydratase-like [Nicotiana tabacum]|uniref:2-hydroxyisoflavanone dehydratase-like n=2 Tax=Nicotiana TaxID=4085 RepID=A0A1S4AAA5_TOBAC|nr:PREDICTED: 2-hydroxyisoflavanone dehydratase-like [Nicotiana sylvestris]XP_016473519.1 PREDICTED: 2-hydroxyisoflavanone dehydratase-like [Nicotiana tabacum]
MAEIVHDLFPLIRVYKDGRIERLLGEGVVPAELDPETGVQIKDVQIDPKINLSARLYLPKNLDQVQKIPLFVYFHGGGFVIESASSPSYHKHLNLVATEANVIIVSVNYRLAPEYPLPIAYEDSWLALKWIASHAKGEGHEPWLKDHADLNHVYFGGDSAGANIAHNIAIRVGLEKLDGVKLDGIFLACPYFWGIDLIDGEAENLDCKNYIEKLWAFAHPNSSGLDDPLMNPEKDPKLSSLGCDKVLVYVAGKDPLKYRGLYYKELLEKSGWQGTVEVVEIKDEEHVFHLFAPTSENAMVVLKKLVSFLNQSKA